MKFTLIIIAAFALYAVMVEGMKGRVKCSRDCWERLPDCKARCKVVRSVTHACHGECQEKVAECIRDECGVIERVDSFEEHRKYD
ncbi:hypothetical protein P879_00594 [Paragonimus westermani]|uniref:Extracellular membrane protein CFEM domain-containing protein n=1 Tax=Paragonimus westermani TaxID=34504 RepID=A0A8T0DVF3_9TREM|nr:hypothetical protein P879_00594 [Paragonimus westermani]